MGLYPPMAYLLQLPAKRIRPIALLMAHELYGGKAEDVLDEALGIELFHNFTLMHDDIMDASPLRRGDATVHVKWNTNAAILSGDALLVKAYELLGRDPRALRIFSQHALEVCEGQQLDMDFELRDRVSTAEYMEMVRLKTAVLLACSMRIGAALANAPEADVERIGEFGERIGLAFQLRDDLLDAFGDPQRTGKQRGGDLLAGKKTWILIRGLEKERADGLDALQVELRKEAGSRNVERMIEALGRSGVRAEAEALVQGLETKALEDLHVMNVPMERKAPLFVLADQLMARTQ